MPKKITIEEFRLPPAPSIMDKINDYAFSKGLERKNGAFFKDNRFYGTLFQLGREAGIDMHEYK